MGGGGGGGERETDVWWTQVFAICCNCCIAFMGLEDCVIWPEA